MMSTLGTEGAVLATASTFCTNDGAKMHIGPEEVLPDKVSVIDQVGKADFILPKK